MKLCEQRHLLLDIDVELISETVSWSDRRIYSQWKTFEKLSARLFLL